MCHTFCCIFYVKEKYIFFHGNNKWWDSVCVNPEVENEIKITIQLSSYNPNLYTGWENAGSMVNDSSYLHHMYSAIGRNEICISYLLASCPYTFGSSIHKLNPRNIIFIVVRNTSSRPSSWSFGSTFLYFWCCFSWDGAFGGSLHRKKM